MLIELAGCGRDAVSEEQQRANLAVQRFRIAETFPQGFNFGLDFGFFAHSQIVQRITYKSLN